MSARSMQSDNLPLQSHSVLNEQKINSNRRILRIWLRIVLFTLFALVIVGGATRLTDSGLSITEWKPIHGAIPPLTAVEWQEEFDLYKRIPQYQEINKGMSVDEFKVIFWWEWAHRLLARTIGLVFALPLAYFWVTGKVERRAKAPLIGLLALGGFQGFIGWWMVSSGLSVRTDVSQYRLAVHLVVACLILAGCVWVLRALTPQKTVVAPETKGKRLAVVLALLCVFQIYLGALVAGLDAGLSYNTWPLMDGAIIPADLFLQQPWWINLFENPKTVQFIHRVGAYILFALALWHMASCLKNTKGTDQARQSVIFFGLVCVQAMLGIAALLTQVHLHTALAHQGMALLVLGYAVIHWRGYLGAYPYENKA